MCCYRELVGRYCERKFVVYTPINPNLIYIICSMNNKGDVVWNEQGHTFSWRMKLRTKRCSGELLGYQPEESLAFEIPWEDYIYCRNYYRGMTRPWMIIQLAHMLGAAYASANGTRAEIYYNVCVSLSSFSRITFDNSRSLTHDVVITNNQYRWCARSTFGPCSHSPTLT